MGTFGPQTLQQTGRIVQVSADGAPVWKSGGITVDWDAIDPVGEDTTLDDGVIVANGDKFIRYGTVLVRQASGLYAPSGGGDLARGTSFILNQSVVASAPGSSHPAVFDAGKVWRDRLLVGGTGQPTIGQVEAAFPGLLFVDNETA